ncbi:hypothetical protein LCGC14_2154640 [marine sediment metagenome]|uniref:Uncharacterized protein n=1 Tax=marine sediment metagenome TaxID=412755 RepID=A0A0F9DUG0_9ZZZZ
MEKDEGLKDELVKAYGTQILKDYEIVLDKIAAVIAAHLYAGKIGDNPLCVLNRALDIVVN